MNENMKTLIIVALMLVVHSLVLAAETNRYPNEVDGYRFYASASWRTLVPLSSNMAEVRKVLGEPTRAKDIADYMAPYPGDEKAQQPVWTYDLDDEWQILVYFVKSGYFERKLFDKSRYDTLYSIDYVPRKTIRFDLAKLPPAFMRTHTLAACAAWDEYADGSGLVYEVYTSKPQFGGNVPGDLNRIRYGPPKESIPNQQNKNMAQPSSVGDVQKTAHEK